MVIDGLEKLNCHNRSISKLSITALFGFYLGGCALVIPQTFVSPNEVTIPEAMSSIACGLKTYQNELARLNLNPGTLTDQIDVTLDLKASATGTSTLVVDAKPSNIIPIGINYSDKIEQIGSRGNTIKISFKNIHTANLNKAGENLMKRQPMVLGPPPNNRLWLDKPCSDVTDPISTQQLLSQSRTRNAQP